VYCNYFPYEFSFQLKFAAKLLLDGFNVRDNFGHCPVVHFTQIQTQCPYQTTVDGPSGLALRHQGLYDLHMSTASENVLQTLSSPIIILFSL